MAALGFGRREIAHRLRCSEATVRTHTFNAYRRLGVSSQAEAWSALGWLAVPDR